VCGGFAAEHHATNIDRQQQAPGSNGTAAAIAGNASTGWWRGTVVERRSLAGELSLSCA